MKAKLWDHSFRLQPERRLNVKLHKHSFSLFCKNEAHIFLIRGGYILCACKSAAGLINTPTDSQCNILQALCVWSQCILCSTTPLSFLPRFPPTFGTFFLLPWEPPQFSQLLWPPTVSVDCSVWLCRSALPSETYGPVQEAGHKEDLCVALTLSPLFGSGGWIRKLNWALAQKAEN